jgi:hypothetical protein
MKLLRDSFRWRVLRPRLFAARPRANLSYTVTVPAPRASSVRQGERAVSTASVLPGLR